MFSEAGPRWIQEWVARKSRWSPTHKINAEIVLAANAAFIGARSAEYFAFAIKFSTFNKVYQLRNLSAGKSALLLAAKRYLQLHHSSQTSLRTSSIKKVWSSEKIIWLFIPDNKKVIFLQINFYSFLPIFAPKSHLWVCSPKFVFRRKIP